MSAKDRARGVAARGVLREIDEQLNRLGREEKAIMREREQLLELPAPRWLAGPARAPRAAGASPRMTSPRSWPITRGRYRRRSHRHSRSR